MPGIPLTNSQIPAKIKNPEAKIVRIEATATKYRPALTKNLFITVKKSGLFTRHLYLLSLSFTSYYFIGNYNLSTCAKLCIAFLLKLTRHLVDFNNAFFRNNKL